MKPRTRSKRSREDYARRFLLRALIPEPIVSGNANANASTKENVDGHGNGNENGNESEGDITIVLQPQWAELRYLPPCLPRPRPRRQRLRATPTSGCGIPVRVPVRAPFCRDAPLRIQASATGEVHVAIRGMPGAVL